MLNFSFFKSKSFVITAIVVFFLFFIVGYVGGTLVSYTEGWFGAGPTFWNALKPF